MEAATVFSSFPETSKPMNNSFLRTGSRIALMVLLLSGYAHAQSPADLPERAAAAGLDPALVETALARGAASGLEVAEVARLIQPAIELGERGLPGQFVLQKVLEGLTKRVPPAQLAIVVARLEAATDRAGARADNWLARSDVPRSMRGAEARTSIIDGLAQGMAQENAGPVLEALLERLPSDLRRTSAGPADVSAALRIAPTLPTAAAAPAETALLLGQALRSGFSGGDLLQLPAALQSLQAREGLAAAAALARALEHVQERQLPAATVLDQLARGGGPPAGPPANVRPRGGRP